MEEIWNDFREATRKVSKRLTKWSYNQPAENDSDLEAFISIINKMCKARNISDDGFPIKNLKELYNFLVQRNKGVILLAKDSEGVIVGVDMLVYQGSSVVMYKGATDPDRRDLPISHL